MARDHEGDDDRRHTDRRLNRVEQDVRDMTAAANEERTMMHEDLAKQRAGLTGHVEACVERWKANDEKWEVNDKRHTSMSGKLNAIIGASFLTLLTVCGFFIALWIDRQDERAARRVDHTHPAQAD